MAILYSDIESEEYSKHYGKTKFDIIGSGKQKSEAAVLKGNVRVVYDTLSCHRLLAFDQVAFGWKFSEDVTIIDGTLRVSGEVPGSFAMKTFIYDRDDPSATVIYELFDPIPTDVIGSKVGLENEVAKPYIPKGAAVGFTPEVNFVMPDVTLHYSLIFASAL